MVLNLQEKRFDLSLKAKNYLSSLKGECYIISVSGNPLVGKSSLLNLLLSLFTHSNTDAFRASDGKIPWKEIYRIGNGKKATTEEIDMFCISVEDKNYIFFDIEGDNDPGRRGKGVWIYTNLIQTALGASHIHIYNYNGIPQDTFLSYFESINQIVKQNQLHPEFKTKHVFLKRNHLIPSDSNSFQELEEIKSAFREASDEFSDESLHERLIQGDLDYSSHFLTVPPEHMTDRKALSSCLNSTGFLCESCQGNEFTIILLRIYKDLSGHLNKVTPFKSGKEFLQLLEQIVEINAKQIPFFLDQGYISKIRSERLKKEQIRIQSGLLKAEQLQNEKAISKDVHKIMTDHPNIAQTELIEKFTKTQANLSTKISQIEYIFPELKNFVEAFILDKNATILNEKEKNFLLDIYVYHFSRLTKEILDSFQLYEEAIQAVCTSLEEVRRGIKSGLKEYQDAVFCTKLGSFASIMAFLAARHSASAGREFAGFTSLLRAEGIVGTGLTAMSLMLAKLGWNKMKNKNEEYLNPKKIAGIDKENEDENEMQKIEEFATKVFENFQQRIHALRKFYLRKENRNFLLVQRIEEEMDNKIKGVNLSPESRLNLLEVLEAAQNNVARFKEFL